MTRPPAAVVDAYPLSRLQTGMIYHAELEGDASYYHDIYSLRVRGPWVESAFRAAFDGLVSAHDAFRTSFALTRFSEPLQLVHAAVDVPLEVVDLRGHDRETAERMLADWRQAETERPFELDRAPLFRVVVHLLDDREFHFWWSFHHAMIDGWSLHSAVAEVFAGYTAIRQGSAPAFPTPKTRYRDYIALEIDALESVEQQDFWRSELAGGAPALLGTPVRRGAGEPASMVEVAWHDVPEGVLSGLSGLAARLQVPIRTVLLSAHLRMLAGLLGRHDVTTGVVGNGRPETGDAEQIKGLFISTYPLCVELPASGWAEFARAVFDRETAILPHRRYPLAAMVEETGWSPFDVVFDYRRFRSYEGLSEQDDLDFEICAYYEHTNYPLTCGMVMSPDGSSLRLQLRYDPRRFEAESVGRLGRGYLTVLEQIAADPDSAVLATPLLAPQDLAAVCHRAAGSVHEIDGRQGLYERIERGAVPMRSAVRAIDGELTYAELLDAAGRIAGYLSDAGVAPDDAVGVCMARGRLLVPALLAVLRLGANYVALDPEYPVDRLRYIAGHSGTAVVLHDRSSADVAAELGPQALAVEEAAEHGRVAEPVRVTADDLAYTIYTSGSTGLPKGVQVRHGSVINLLDSLAEVLSLDEQFTYLATTSISFDIHVNEIFLPLVLGATVLLAARDQVADGKALRALIEAELDLVAQGPPAMWRLLLDAGWRPYGMGAVLCGGEAFPRDLADRLVGDGAPVWNMYGPTETTVWSAVHPVTGGEGVVAIGRPLLNTTMWVLDEHMDVVFPGVPGELYIGGEGLARGYHGRPDLTADRFVPDPFAGPDRPGARLYRTGDLVRAAGDGTFEYLERVDLQVKIRGYRIELEEVEARLGAHPDVSAAVVTAPLGDDGERVLAGYVVAAPSVDGPQLREWCAAALPEYMVPRAWLLLDALPITPNGKVDRRALPAPGAPNGIAADEGAAPSTDTERKLAMIWSEVLELPSVGVHANFFDLGGNSLRALRVVLKIREELGVEIPVAALIQSSSVRRLAALVDQSEGREAHPLILPLNSEGHPSLFMFHPLGGHVFGYAPLAGALDGTVTVYGVRALGMEPDESPLDSIAAMADRYVADLRRLQPEGPYHLAGWCMGATVAVEVARRLAEQGERLDFLGLVVADPFDPAPRALLDDQAALVMHAMGGGADVDYDELAALGDVERQVNHVFSSGLATGSLRDDVTSPDDAYRLLGVYRASAAAISSRQIAPYDGEAHVFVLAEADPFPPDMGWSTVVAGPVRRHELPGGPGTFLETDHVSRLAEIIGDEVLGARRPIPDPDRVDDPRHPEELTHGR